MRSLLIANRGEIACRIIHTAKAMGIRTIAVYSNVDKQARHVRLADEAHYLGPAAAKESYLCIDKILRIAKQSHAEAIHPGYGFLSENAEFAEACVQAGIIFVGPKAAAIRLMGSKSAAKACMQAAGVPVVPGYHEADQSLKTLQAAAEKIGYPVLLKAVAGGGGKGMRIVQHAKDFADSLAGAKREALASFNDDTMLIEKYINHPRHIEIQVFADTQGHAVHLFERDCSIQRRHQKVLEEAPAPHMTQALRQAMGTAAVQAAKAIDYVGAGTIEFLLDAQGAFYFMEMNTRLQVEHPITEKITGQDLVEWQLKVAIGQPLPLLQPDIRLQGHAMEVRIYAEDPMHHFLPATGHIHYCATPALSEHVRIDTGVSTGDEISIYYDPLIAKLIVWDKTRELCCQRLQKALAEYQVVGVTTNIAFLRQLSSHPAFTAAQIDTGFIERHYQALCPATEVARVSYVFAALYQLLSQKPQHIFSLSPWQYHDYWQLNIAASVPIAFEGRTLMITPIQANDYVIEGMSVSATLSADGHTLSLQWADGEISTAVVIPDRDSFHVLQAGRSDIIRWQQRQLTDYSEAGASGKLSAPMPGTIIAVHVNPGATVAAGDPLIVMEAMKMEHTLTAPTAGVVADILYNVGSLVTEGAELLRLNTIRPAGKEHANQ